MNSLLRIPYSATWAAARKVAAHVTPGGSKIRRVLAARNGVLDRFEKWAATGRDPGRQLLWVHAPSVGEGLQALPVLQLVRSRLPDIQIAYTFYSPSAEHFARELATDFTDYLPFDTTGDSLRAIEALRPTALVYSKLDIWPLLTEAASERGVKLGVISATLPTGSQRSGILGRELLGDAYRKLDSIGAIRADDAERFQMQGVAASRIRVTGDTRYDQVWDRARRSGEIPAVRSLHSDRQTLVAGSTWPSDERRLLPAWNAVTARFPRARLIIAPHEISELHVRGIIGWAKTSGRSVARIDAASPDTDVILVDRTGVLGDLYALGCVAYVGGGFHGAGLHSVLEPAAFGIPVLFGPRSSKSADARTLQLAEGGVEVRDAAAIEITLRRFLESAGARESAGEKAKAVVRSGLGAAERSYELVAGLMGRG